MIFEQTDRKSNIRFSVHVLHSLRITPQNLKIHFWGFAQNCVVKLNTEEVVLCENPGVVCFNGISRVWNTFQRDLIKGLCSSDVCILWTMAYAKPPLAVLHNRSKMNSRERQKRFCDVEYSYIVGKWECFCNREHLPMQSLYLKWTYEHVEARFCSTIKS